MNRRKERLDRGIKVRSDSIYLLSSFQEIFYLMFPRLILFAFFILVPLLLSFSPYWQKVFVITCVYILLAMSFDFLSNFVGLACLGSSFFIGVGGYFSGFLNTQFALSQYFSIFISTILGSAFCSLLILPVLSLRGAYFAIVTLILPLFMGRVVETFNILGGTNGLLGIDGFGSTYVEIYFISITTMLLLFALRRILISDIGIVIKGVKDNDQAIKASGINPTFVKTAAVFIASILGCFAGAFLTHLYMWAGISLFALDFSIIPIAAVIIGGGGSIFGAILGAVLIVPLSEFLRDFGALRIAIYSIILTIVIVFKSEGILNYLHRKYNQFERWRDI